MLKNISVCDREGNVASLTNSNGEGCGYFIPETGIMLNNMMGEEDLFDADESEQRPGVRATSLMCPSIVKRQDDVYMALGSGGCNRIPFMIFQVMANVINYGKTVAEAITAPRIFHDGHTLQIEPGFSKTSIKALSKIWTCKEWEDKSIYFGGVHAAAPNGDGGGDERRDGTFFSF